MISRNLPRIVGVVILIALVGAVVLRLPQGDSNDNVSRIVPSDEIEPSAEVEASEVPTTTTPEPPETTLPPTIDVWLSPEGDDLATGRSAEDPVATVDRAKELVEPGSVVYLSGGSYGPLVFHGWRGELGKPITVKPMEAELVIVEDESFDRTAAIWIEESEHLVVSGMQLQNSLWAVEVRYSSHLVIADNNISAIGQEAIHLRMGTNNVVVKGNSISDTGRREDYALGGSGVYVGSADGLDPVFSIEILDNDIFNTASEGIDVKGGTWDVLIEGNDIHDIRTLQSGGVVLHLVDQGPDFDPGLVVRRNRIWNISSGTQWADGNGIVVGAAATIEENLIYGNEHRGVLVEAAFNPDAPNTVTLRRNTVVDNGRFGMEIRGDAAAVELFDNIIEIEGAVTRWSGGGNITPEEAQLDDDFLPTSSVPPGEVTTEPGAAATDKGAPSLAGLGSRQG